MTEQKQPTFGHGKICYLEIPSTDINRSAEFFRKVFNWSIRTNNEGNTSFDDGVGQVSGVWLTGKKPETGGVQIHIMVDDAEATLKNIMAAGGTIVQPIGAHAPEITARFADPDGNEWGIYQHRGSNN